MDLIFRTDYLICHDKLLHKILRNSMHKYPNKWVQEIPHTHPYLIITRHHIIWVRTAQRLMANSLTVMTQLEWVTPRTKRSSAHHRQTSTRRTNHKSSIQLWTQANHWRNIYLKSISQESKLTESLSWTFRPQSTRTRTATSSSQNKRTIIVIPGSNTARKNYRKRHQSQKVRRNRRILNPLRLLKRSQRRRRQRNVHNWWWTTMTNLTRRWTKGPMSKHWTC